MPGAPIDFWFEFNSPYGYIGATLIDKLAARWQREVVWHPFLLGVIFRETGARPMREVPIKGAYQSRDAARLARFYNVPYREPDVHPFSPVAASRAFWWADAQDKARAKQLALALYRAALSENRSIATPEGAADVAAEQGWDRAAALAGMANPAVKQKLADETEAARQKGVFGSPFVICDGEPFWGVDRFFVLERWLAPGPF